MVYFYEASLIAWISVKNKDKNLHLKNARERCKNTAGRIFLNPKIFQDFLWRIGPCNVINCCTLYNLKPYNLPFIFVTLYPGWRNYLL